jgi:3-oxoacyl-[acyl-carrier protein] reductase
VNPVALITGASRGIGRGIAVALARHRHDLVINYRSNQTAAGETVAACQAAAQAAGHRLRIASCQADVSDTADRERLMAFTRQHFGRLDVLVNNAGVAPEVRADLLDVTEESFDRLLATNAKGPFFLTQLAARWMMEQRLAAPPTAASATLAAPGSIPSSDHGYQPKIITITSLSAYTASTHRGDYCMSKAALAMLTPLFAARLAEHGIHVYEIRPGLIATDMTGPVRQKYDELIAAGLTPIARWGTPEDVGRAVAALALDWLPFSTGEVLNIDGGFHLRRL